MSTQSRGVIFSEQNKTDAPQHRQGLGSTICRYLPLFAVNPSAICRYLPLFAVSLSTICRYLPLVSPLFAAICRWPFR